MRKYRRISYHDREEISRLIKKGLNLTEIARKLGFHCSSIAREVKRNKGQRGYRYKQAHKFSMERRESVNYHTKMTPAFKEKIFKLIQCYWSPQQISCRLKRESEASISHERIYQLIYEDYINGGELYKYLRHSHKKRKRRIPRSERGKRGHLKNIIPISKRGSSANNRKSIGHWERDMMLDKSRSAGVLVIIDRKSRFAVLDKLRDHKAKRVCKSTIKKLEEFPVESITNDRGKEFALHKEVSEALKTKVYFCDPYSSQQRGTNENKIGILRQFIPKGKSIKWMKTKTLDKIEDLINNRPMKCLDWRTPYEVMFKTEVALTS